MRRTQFLKDCIKLKENIAKGNTLIFVLRKVSGNGILLRAEKSFGYSSIENWPKCNEKSSKRLEMVAKNGASVTRNANRSQSTISDVRFILHTGKGSYLGKFLKRKNVYDRSEIERNKGVPLEKRRQSQRKYLIFLKVFFQRDFAGK